MAWLKLAKELHMSPDRCKTEHTYRQLLRWQAFNEMDANSFNPTHYYLAQIAREVALFLSTKEERRKFGLDPWLMKFAAKPDGEVEIDERTDEEKAEAAAERSKATWSAIFVAAGAKPPPPAAG